MSLRIITGVCGVAALATLADATWYALGVRHTLTAGVIHGAVVLSAVGGAIGWVGGRTMQGFPIGALAGVGGAVSYYVLVATFDARTYGRAIPAAWVLTWVYLAVLDGLWLRAPRRRSWGQIVARGLLAAFGSGVAFSLVLNLLWGAPPSSGRNYLVQFLAWSVAWAPGIAALVAGSHPRLAGGSGDMAAKRAAIDDGPSAVRELDRNDAGASISAADLLALIDSGEAVHILDVRSEGEFEAGHVPGAVNVPFTLVSSRIADVPGTPDETLVVYCGHGPRAYIAGGSLRRAGRRRITYLSGHWSSWQGAGLRVER